MSRFKQVYVNGETYSRCCRLASALSMAGIVKGDTVAAMLPNIPAMVEAHFGVPMCGAVLNTLNTRLDPDAIAYMLEFAEAKAILVDREFSETLQAALDKVTIKPLVINVEDEEYDGPGFEIGEVRYKSFITDGNPDYDWQLHDDKWDAICLNYTYGTTGKIQKFALRQQAQA
ncbi:AMP-binding protein [Oleiphilus messinensis]|nr:AMP-binding protein [Oleiphilus messinensis]